MLNFPLNGQIRVGNQTFAISRGSDFADFQTQAPRETQFRAVEVLKEMCASFGETRSHMTDLYRQRLHQMRQHLRMS